MIRVGRVVRPSRMKLHRSSNGDQNSYRRFVVQCLQPRPYLNTRQSRKREICVPRCAEFDAFVKVVVAGYFIYHIGHVLYQMACCFHFGHQQFQHCHWRFQHHHCRKSFVTIIGSSVAEFIFCVIKINSLYAKSTEGRSE